MTRVVVTVGMGRWPFDRLIAAADRLAAVPGHDVFAQIGCSTVVPHCPHARFLPPDELDRLLATADVVITHAGNSVRLVQRLGKVPIAVARDPDLGEMGNDHQGRFLETERRRGRVVVLDDLEELRRAVADHPSIEVRLLGERAGPPPPRDRRQLSRLLDRVAFGADGPSARGSSPFEDHVDRRFAWAWARLADLDGPHLDVGSGTGIFAGELARARAGRGNRSAVVVGADPHAGYLDQAARGHPALAGVRIAIDDRLPFADATFASVSMLDALEHVPDDDALLAEAHRVLRPGGALVVSVPSRHLLSLIDPDNVKFTAPRLHRAVYRRRFGCSAYHQRFVDTSDGLIGDMSVGRSRHTNYRQRDLVDIIAGAGFTPLEVDGANRWWRLYHAPALLGGVRLARWCERRMRADGRRHHEANLFCIAMRR